MKNHNYKFNLRAKFFSVVHDLKTCFGKHYFFHICFFFIRSFNIFFYYFHFISLRIYTVTVGSNYRRPILPLNIYAMVRLSDLYGWPCI